MGDRQWYNKETFSMPGTLFVVATPIGNLDDLSGRAARVLREVSLIAAEDTRRTGRLLSRYGIRTATTSLHEHNEEQKCTALVARLLRGDDVALVSDAGTPGVSDPGRRFVRAARDAAIPVIPIPGPSAVLAALSASGFPADTFMFLGFPPVRSKDRKKWLDELRSARRTVIFFEAPHRIRSTLEAIHAAIGDVPLFLGRELTKVHESSVVGPISEVLTSLDNPIGEFTGVLEIGRTTELRPTLIPSDADLAHELGLMIENGALTRRQALVRLSRKYGMTPNEMYAAVERGRKSVN
jgi:16S rRNA (cytidine1402-2'-O)-methyltransferase